MKIDELKIGDKIKYKSTFNYISGKHFDTKIGTITNIGNSEIDVLIDILPEFQNVKCRIDKNDIISKIVTKYDEFPIYHPPPSVKNRSIKMDIELLDYKVKLYPEGGKLLTVDYIEKFVINNDLPISFNKEYTIEIKEKT